MWMNEPEIDDAMDVIAYHEPELARFAKYLGDWREVVNSNSDGWHSWKAGPAAAGKLQDLVKRTTDVIRGRGGDLPTEKEFMKTLSPIKACATKFKLTAPELEQPQLPGLRQ
jgi:hypothetical protein